MSHDVDALIETMAWAMSGGQYPHWPHRKETEREQYRENARIALSTIRAAGYAVVPADLISAAQRLVFEVRYFDDHEPGECAVIRAAGALADDLELSEGGQ